MATLTRQQVNDLDEAIHLCGWCKARADALVPAEPDPPAATATPDPATVRPYDRERATVGKRDMRKDASHEQ